MTLKSKLLCGLLAGGLTVVLTTGVAFASIGAGTVTAEPSLRMRSQPSTSSSTLTTVPTNAKVDVLEDAGNGWYKVSYRDMEGYMSGEWLSITLDGDADDAPAAPPQDAEPQEPDAAPAAPAAETGRVNDGPLNVRSGPGTDYSRVGSLNAGAAVTVTEKLDGWYQVTGGGVTGYVSAQYITLDTAVRSESVTGSASVETADPEKGYVNTSALNVRSGPDTACDKVGMLHMGDSVSILAGSNGWYQITSGSVAGYVSAEYISLGEPPAGSALGAQATALAWQQLGKRYVYGATGPYAFDCSGLTYYIYRTLGVNIARGSSSQYYNTGYFVAANLNTMQPGDLLLRPRL